MKKEKAETPIAFPDPVPESEWANWPDEKLQDMRMCDLQLGIQGSDLE